MRHQFSTIVVGGMAEWKVGRFEAGRTTVTSASSFDFGSEAAERVADP